MRVLFAFCVIFVTTSRCVQGNSWLKNFEEAVKNFSEEELRKVDPDRSRARSFKHPRAFQCPDMSSSSSVPTSVELVKAADIKVIAALGDSLTTGVAANASSIVEVPIEYRQLSWSIGGQGTYDDVITLANIVKLFNPNVIGASPTSSVTGQPTTLDQTGLNLAVTGANSRDFPAQARNLIDTLKNYSAINFTEDWKLVTVLIGMNDICDSCKNKTLYSVENFISSINESLHMMMDEVPRLIVNVVQIFTMEPLRQVQEPTVACQLQRLFCSCLVTPAENSTDLTEVVALNRGFQTKLEELLNSSTFFKNDFAVVLQPYLSSTDLPKLPNGTVDFSYFSPDCFHFSVKGHEEMAKGLWNNMFQQDGEKVQLANLTDSVTLICPPTDHPYIYTRPRALSSAATQGHTFALVTLLTSLAIVFRY
ncbi:phospholipase B1, membrane-associated-like [Alosa alosa]|uniref:phospholipase B1, membrane-associated-like n=1 Tax=Alosa alosa TaxID=278164 RepID=UPI0020152A3E|nr:phospholipase B1, membrane-associated-like [Alosa alosa]